MKTKAAIILLALPLLAMCSKDIPQPQMEFDLTISSVADDIPELKTSMQTSGTEGRFTTTWSAGDKMQIYIDGVTTSSSRKYILTNKNAGTTATFTGTVGTTSGQKTIYGFYPASALVSGSESGSTVSVTLPCRQSPSITSFDPACDILAAKPMQVSFTYGASASVVNVQFARQLAIVKIIPLDSSTGSKLSADKVLSVTMTAGSLLSGKAKLDLESSTITGWTSQDSSKCVKAVFDASRNFKIGTNSAILMAAPGTLASGSSLIFEIGTDKHTITKTVTLTENVKLAAGKISNLKVYVKDSEIKPIAKPTIAGWAELPEINDADKNGVDDKDTTIYYAAHSFTLSKKKYRNYTVCFSGTKHCPLWVAAPRHDCYEGSTGRTDAYTDDPDIPSDIQYSSKSTGGSCNKGHMLGSAERTVCPEANRQVFYYSNIAPQLSSGFNTGGGGWNILEDWVDGKVCSDTLYVVIGAYFNTFTDGYGETVSPKTISFGGRSDIGFPTMFYYILLRTKSGKSGKAVKNCSASELQCAAFVRSHTNSHKGQKVSSKDLMSVSDLEKITGFTYFVNVPNAPKGTCVASDWGL